MGMVGVLTSGGRRLGALERDETEAVFVAVFRAEFARLVRLAVLLGSDDPEDTAQEAFARLHEYRARLATSDAATAYVRTILVNLCRSRLRHLKVVRREHPMVSQFESPSPEAHAILRADQTEVLAALGKLPTRQREVLILRYWMDLPGAEIAVALGISVGAVKSHTARAMESIARLLEVKV